MNGTAIKALLEDVADNLFHADPYYQQGGDMVRIGGHVVHDQCRCETMGRRISEMTLLRRANASKPARVYVVAGWASVPPKAR